MRESNLAWTFRWVIIPGVCAAFLIGGAVEIGPALGAAEGHGTIGYWVAEVEHCTDSGGCGWTGNFTLPDGRITRTNVSYFGPHGNLYQGARLPALDTGGPGEVFGRHGSGAWVGDLVITIIGAIGIGLWTWRILVRRLRRRGRVPDFLVPSV